MSGENMNLSSVGLELTACEYSYVRPNRLIILATSLCCASAGNVRKQFMEKNGLVVHFDIHLADSVCEDCSGLRWAHWPTDVIDGMVIGILSGQFVQLFSVK